MVEYYQNIVPVLRFYSDERFRGYSLKKRPAWIPWEDWELEKLRRLYAKYDHPTTPQRREWFPHRTSDSVAIKAGRIGITKPMDNKQRKNNLVFNDEL